MGNARIVHGYKRDYILIKASAGVSDCLHILWLSCEAGENNHSFLGKRSKRFHILESLRLSV